MIGQNPPEADLSLAHEAGEEQILLLLYTMYNPRMFSTIEKVYAPTCQWNGPLMRGFYGPASVLHQTMRLVALIPDCVIVAQHMCSIDSEECGRKYAVHWCAERSSRVCDGRYACSRA